MAVQLIAPAIANIFIKLVDQKSFNPNSFHKVTNFPTLQPELFPKEFSEERTRDPCQPGDNTELWHGEKHCRTIRLGEKWNHKNN